jgi:competence protein ComEC
VRPHLERAPVNQLDGLFLTHADSYHTAALPALLELFHPRAVWQAAGKSGPGPGAPTAGQTFTLDEGVRLEVLFPPETWQAAVADDRATVLRLEYGGFRLLFMSDAGFLTEKALLASGVDLRSDVLVMGRHGSDFCGLPEFIRAVHPGALVCSNSRFPESERAPESWRERVARMGITVFDQAVTGAVSLRLDSAGLSAHAFSNSLTWNTPRRPIPPWSTLPEKPGPLIR